jgi:hypothetical protein
MAKQARLTSVASAAASRSPTAVETTVAEQTGEGDVLAPPTRAGIVELETGELEVGGEIEREESGGGAIGEGEGRDVEAGSEVEAKVVDGGDKGDAVEGDDGAVDGEGGLGGVGECGGQLRGRCA